MKKSWQISGLLAALLLAAQGVGAAGLGKLSVRSALGQPLRAEIELLSVQPDEIAALNAQLASADAFRQARISRTEAHKSLQFSVEQRANGTPYLRVTSSAPINDPFLDLLIELNWSSGRILRDYTVLLDPPVYDRPQLEMAQSLGSSAPTQPKPASDSAATSDKPVKTTATKPAAERKAPAPTDATRYGPIKSGETLRSIAGKTRHTDVSLEMMMASLYKANQQAFLDGNMNLLKKGQVLNVPNRDAVMLAYSPSQAKQLVREHTTEWRDYRGQVADAASKAPAAKEPASAAETGKIAVAKPAQKPAEPAPAKDVIRLSKGDPGSAKPDEKMAQRIQSLEEELAARSRALQEAQDRVAQLERTVNDLQKLMALKAEQAGQAQPEADPAHAAAPTPDAAPEAKQEAAPPPKPKAPVPTPPPPPEEPGLLSTLLENPLYIGGLLSALLLSVLGGYKVFSGRRRKALAGFEQSVMTGGDQFKTAMFKTGGTAVLGAGDTTQGTMTELSRLGLGSIDTHEVDPIAEAEVYMAYGRDTQAEEILREALSKDPNRPEISLKLLEIYNARKDVSSFENQAASLYEQQGGSPTPIWQKAAEMGRKLDPANPMYVVEGVHAAETLPEPSESIAEPTTEPAAAEEPGQDVAEPEPFQADAPAMQPEEAPLEFDLGQPAEAPSSPAEDTDDLNVIAFDLPAPLEPAASKAEEPESLGMPEIEMSFDAPQALETIEPEPIEPELEAPLEPIAPEAGADADDFSLDFEPLEAPAPAEPETEIEAPPPVADLDFAGLEEIQLEAPVTEIELEAAPAHPSDEPEPDLDDLLSTDFPTEDIEAAPALQDQDISPFEAELELETPALEPLHDLPLEEPAELTAAPALPEFDLADLEMEPLTEAEPTQAPPAAAPELDFAGIDLDLVDLPDEPDMAPAEAEAESASAGIDPELWEEVNTKLDLSKAYLEMGDREGAREILQEVLTEGDADQKAEAARLIAESE